MSHAKIAAKIPEVMQEIPDKQSLSKLNQILLKQKLITKTEYEIAESKERVTAQGVVWQIVTVSCQLTIIDVESDEILVYIALGTGIDAGDMAVAKAQVMARKYAWLSALGIDSVVVQDISGGPDIIVETPESKLIAHITALWKWDASLFPDYVVKRLKKPIEQLNLAELTVLKTELENYGRQ